MVSREAALLVLEDGTVFAGEAFGAQGRQIAEVVFNTSMSGYQEILTDPSYRGQLVTLTSVHVGNYGTNALDVESARVQASGLIVRSASSTASNFRSTRSLDAYLKEEGCVAITGVDTRALTRHIRDRGMMMGVIAHGAREEDVPRLLEEVRAAPRYEEGDYVSACSVTAARRALVSPSGDAFQPFALRLAALDEPWEPSQAGLVDIAVLDFGVKYSILRHLHRVGFRSTLLPHDATLEQIQALGARGVLLSNGPGDPGRMDGAVDAIRGMLGALPIFGICLGHQLLSRALGGETFKLTFGHRGPNQPVWSQDRGRVEITSQNHSFAVSFPEAVLEQGVEVTHRNLNDGTIEGVRVPSLRAFSVQHHPEAGPGPHDATLMFEAFYELVRSHG